LVARAVAASVVVEGVLDVLDDVPVTADAGGGEVGPVVALVPAVSAWAMRSPGLHPASRAAQREGRNRCFMG